MNFDEYFAQATTDRTTGLRRKPREWQRELATEAFGDRLIRIPTGFGKTLGVLIAWLWHAVRSRDEAWPRRLVICLPMRVLVEQTRDEVAKALDALGLLWDGESGHDGKVGLHVLMGGVDRDDDWYLFPEQFAVFVTTQDMALSTALNRGYAVPRARWPVEFGLLNQDTLWVMDEVQLMDVGMATSAQLQAFRNQDRDAGKSLRPCATWWMSATLQRDWLARSPDTLSLASGVPETRIAPAARTGHLWDDVFKPCRFLPVRDVKGLAELVFNEHTEKGAGAAGPTVVVVNTVRRAMELYAQLEKRLRKTAIDLRLVHSRFRPHERAHWRERFLNRDACGPGVNRIVVSTQVIEAGVDLSAALLITELAPWPSLVQRFGRCARWGGRAHVVVADFEHPDDSKAAPYTKSALDAARAALDHLRDVAPVHLEQFEEAHPELLADLYPYEPKHLVLRREVEELFDTTPDLSGADIDISRFIRFGDERDVKVFWVEVPAKSWPSDEVKPARDALCAVPFLEARDWLFAPKGDTFKEGMRAWVWDWVEGRWKRAGRRDLVPGRIVLVATDSGGYDTTRGWEPTGERRRVEPVLEQAAGPHTAQADEADSQEDDEALSQVPTLDRDAGRGAWQTIAVHGREVGRAAQALARILVPRYAGIFDLAGRCHDIGKVHVCFNGSIEPREGLVRPERRDLAKAPESAWLSGRRLYPMPDGTRRAGFRHELASVLALFAILRRHAPDHPALLGPWRQFLVKAGMPPEPVLAPSSPTAPTPLEEEVLVLDAEQFNLLAYLVCAHHGKVRMTWHASPADQAANDTVMKIRGVAEGDTLPSVSLADSNETWSVLPSSPLTLTPSVAGLSPSTGMSWTERVLELLHQHGPFALAWLESLIVAADRRTSRRQDIEDPLLEDFFAAAGVK